jgi:hypothetical protein
LDIIFRELESSFRNQAERRRAEAAVAAIFQALVAAVRD